MYNTNGITDGRELPRH